MLFTREEIMNVVDLFTGYLYKEKDCYEYWFSYMEKDTEIRDKCLQDYKDYNLDPKQVCEEKIFPYSKLDYDYMNQTVENIKEILSDFEQQENEFINLKEFDFTVVLYHGLHNGAGWATDYKNKPAILLGIEKIVQLGWNEQTALENLIHHELAHLIHANLRNEDLEPYTNLVEMWINRLYIEGFATYFESKFSKSTRRDEWVQNCLNIETELKKEYKERLLQNPERCQDFYGDWYQVFELSDTGYFLGRQFIEKLLKQYTSIEVATLSIDTIKNELMNYLGE